MNLEFNLSTETFIAAKLTPQSQALHEKAIRCAQRYLIAEADLLAAIIEVDRDKTFEKFDCTHLTPYCVKHLGLSEDVAAIFVRVARKSQVVPELQEAVEEGRISVTKAKTIASVITPVNHETWIEKAETCSKEKLERAVASEAPSA